MSKQSYWVAGQHAAKQTLLRSPERIIDALVTERNEVLREELQSIGIAVSVVDKQAIERALGGDQHQGIALRVRPQPVLNESDLSAWLNAKDATNTLVLVLDQVQDPHNLGACLRTAVAAGVGAVIVPKDRSAPMSAVVHKVASGAAEVISVFKVTNLVRSLEALKDAGFWVVGTSDRANDSLYAQSYAHPTALVMGAEGKGLRELTMRACDQLVYLPMSGDAVSSLNVSVATGVCLYEMVRQRSKAPTD